jgi:streptogramin lyase
LLLLVLVGCSRPASGPREQASPRIIALPGGEGGIGFDDLQYAPALGRLLVPAGRTGRLDLVDPATGAVTSIGGFTSTDAFSGGHSEGTTSAVDGGGTLYAIDRTARSLVVIDPLASRIVARVPLRADPDYVRWVEPTREIWVTEPDAEIIEVFAAGSGPAPTGVGVIEVAGGPESLVVSPARRRAYTHLWKGRTVAIDLDSRRVVETWNNGCGGSRGIALDDERGWLFVGCAEGAGVVLDVAHDGVELGRVPTGSGVDVIAYAPSIRHLYLPAATSATLAIIDVADSGALTLVHELPTAQGAHCAVTDDRGGVWVCDPAGGRLLELRDSLP